MNHMLTIERSFQLQIKINNIIVNINSKEMNWEMIRILPKIEYLLRPEKAEKRINSIDIPVNNNIRIIGTYMSTKKKGWGIM